MIESLLVGMLLGFGVWLAVEVVKQQRRRPRQQRASRNNDQAQAVAAITRYTSDRGAAERLLSSAAQQYPGRDIHWLTDKVIQDIVRDRRA
jgi:hypothetical protein